MKICNCLLCQEISNILEEYTWTIAICIVVFGVTSTVPFMSAR